MRTDHCANLEMRRLFCVEDTTVCYATHAVLIENENISSRDN